MERASQPPPTKALLRAHCLCAGLQVAGDTHSVPEREDDSVSVASARSAPPDRRVRSLRADFYGLMSSAAGRVGVPMPPPPLQPTHVDLMVGGAYARQKRAAEYMIPAMPALDQYYRGSWHAPNDARAPVSTYNPFTRVVVGFEAQRMGMPRLEETFAAHLMPNAVSSWGSKKPLLPSAGDRFTAQLADKTYVLGAQFAAVTSSVAMLAASMSRLTTGKTVLTAVEIEEISKASAAILHLAQAQAACAGRAMALSVVGQRHLWLTLTTMRETEKTALLNAPLSEEGLFGDAVSKAMELFRRTEEDKRQTTWSNAPQPPRKRRARRCSLSESSVVFKPLNKTPVLEPYIVVKEYSSTDGQPSSLSSPPPSLSLPVVWAAPSHFLCESSEATVEKSLVAYRRERPNIREAYEERFSDRPAPYQRVVNVVERRAPFAGPEEGYDRGNEYDGQRYGDGPRGYHGEGQRGYHGEDQRGYHGESGNFGSERRNGPPYRRDEPFAHYRGSRDDGQLGRQVEFSRNSSRGSSQPSVRGQRLPPPRSLPTAMPNGEDDSLMQAIINMDRGDERREGLRRKGPFPPVRERSPIKRDVPPSPHSRSGSTLSSKSYSPDRSRSYTHQSQPKKKYEEPSCPSRESESDKDKPPSYLVSGSQDGSPRSSVSAIKEEIPALGGEPDEMLMVREDPGKTTDDFQQRRAQAIGAKALEIEKLYRQDCETFGMVVKMLVAKEPGLAKPLQTPLKENLIEIRERCLDDLRHFITELDEVVLTPNPSA